MKKLFLSQTFLLIPHLFVASIQHNSRVAFVLNTVCEWYGWNWSFVKTTEDISKFGFSYGIKSADNRMVCIAEPFPIMDIGTSFGGSSWGSYEGVPNPCLSDPIAGIFYLITCAEEYNSIDTDQHSRVKANDLSVVKNGYGSIPLADRLAEVLAKAVWRAAGYDGTPEMSPELGYSSLDIDQVYAVHHKSWYKRIGNLGRQLLSRDWKGTHAVFNAIAGARDPFDQFGWLREVHEQRNLRPFVFLLMGYQNATDPAWNPDHPQWPTFVAGLKDWAHIGLHPSYRTSTDADLLRDEKQRLEDLFGDAVGRSRQHFLRIAWPDTLQALVKLGISQDFSLAWPDWLGFRMGTARSCFWYDLANDEQTPLRLYPPSMMEVTGRQYLGLSPKQFLESAKHLTQEAKLSNSGLRVIWHNSNLSNLGGWGDWKEVYPSILDLVAD